MKPQARATLWTSTMEEWTRVFNDVPNDSALKEEVLEIARKLKSNELRTEKTVEFKNVISDTTLSLIVG